MVPQLLLANQLQVVEACILSIIAINSVYQSTSKCQMHDIVGASLCENCNCRAPLFIEHMQLCHLCSISWRERICWNRPFALLDCGVCRPALIPLLVVTVATPILLTGSCSKPFLVKLCDEFVHISHCSFAIR